MVPSPPRVTIRSGSERSAGPKLEEVVLLICVVLFLLVIFNCPPVPKPGTGCCKMFEREKRREMKY